MTEPATTTWSSLIGHDGIRDSLAAAISQHRLGGSFLVVGPPGTGKQTIVRLLSQTLLCQVSPPSRMEPCGSCPACQQVRAGTHPDIVEVSKPKERATIPLDSLIGQKEHRMREGFCHDIRIRPLMGDRKVAIIQDADFLNEEGANCLLKTLEEPPPRTLILLIGSSEQRQLPTIRSRCQTIRVGPLSTHAAMRLLREVHGIEVDDERLREVIEISGGDMHLAVRLLQNEADDLRKDVIEQLCAVHTDPVALGQVFNRHLAGCGKDAAKRRAGMRDLLSIAVQHYRQQMRREASENRCQVETLARLDRSIRALREVDRSVNQATLVECFAADIAMATTGDRGGIG